MFKLYVENQHILSHDDFRVIFISFYCSFYIYNISYPNNIKLTLYFIQKILFDLQDDDIYIYIYIYIYYIYILCIFLFKLLMHLK